MTHLDRQQTSALRSPPLRKRQSHLWNRDELDWYVEPEWVSQRLFAVEPFNSLIWDPCAGTGRIVHNAVTTGYEAFASDIDPRQFVGSVQPHDFMLTGAMQFPNIVTNPPFKIAEDIVLKALSIVTGKLACLLTANWVQGDKRSRWLETSPLRRVLFVTPRPSMPPGEVLMAGGKPGNGTTDYAWYIWEPGYAGKPEIGWCRRD